MFDTLRESEIQVVATSFGLVLSEDGAQDAVIARAHGTGWMSATGHLVDDLPAWVRGWRQVLPVAGVRALHALDAGLLVRASELAAHALTPELPGSDTARVNLTMALEMAQSGGFEAQAVAGWLTIGQPQPTSQAPAVEAPVAEQAAGEVGEAAPDPEQTAVAESQPDGPVPEVATSEEAIAPESGSVLEQALAWRRAGYSVVPIRTDGSKRPIKGWEQYQRRLPRIAELHSWFGGGHPALGMVTGRVSAGAAADSAVMIELEGRAVDEGLWPKLQAELAARGHGGLLERIAAGYSERSPSGGWHGIYRVAGAEAQRNTALARRSASDEELTDKERELRQDNPERVFPRVLIETREDHGLTVLAPSTGHESGRPWTRLAGSPETVVTLSAAEDAALREAARALDTMPQRSVASVPVQRAQPTARQDLEGAVRPGDAFNEAMTWEQLLSEQGWTIVDRSGDSLLWAHPGKTKPHEHSAQTGGSIGDVLTVYSTSAPIPNGTYRKFTAYAWLEHGGDTKAAARQLASEGWGHMPERPARQTEPQNRRGPERTAEQPATAKEQAELGTAQPRRSWGGTLTAPDTDTSVRVQVRHTVAYGTWIHGEDLTGIGEALDHARAQGQRLGRWIQATDRTGAQGWHLLRSAGKFATLEHLAGLDRLTRALDQAGIEVHRQVDPASIDASAREAAQPPRDKEPEDGTEPASDPEPEQPVAEQPAPVRAGPRPLTDTERAAWLQAAGKPAEGTAVDLTEVDGRLVLRAKTSLNGHRVQMLTSFDGADTETAHRLAGRMRAYPATIPKMAQRAVTVGAAHAWLDGAPITPETTPEMLAQRLQLQSHTGDLGTGARAAAGGAARTAITRTGTLDPTTTASGVRPRARPAPTPARPPKPQQQPRGARR